MITLGADPEVFVMDETGAVTIGCGKIGGTKHNPLPLSDGYFIQEDNVMAEYNVPPVGVKDADGVYQFARTMKRGARLVAEYLKTKDLYPLWGQGRTEFELVTLQAGGAKALEFGCSPDFDAYANGDAAPKVDPEVLGTTRYAGGHLHIGHDLKLPPFVIASFLDATVGLRSVSLGDRQGDRRLYYGSPGRFRPTPYGLEYRVMSNFWVNEADHAEMLAGNVLTLFKRLERAGATGIKKAFAEIPWTDLRNIISAEDSTMAGKLQRYLDDQVWRNL